MGIGAVIGGFTGSVITYWVAERIGFREGTMRMQKHYKKTQRELETTEMPAPNEEIEKPDSIGIGLGW